MSNRFVPCETFQKVAVAGDATDGKVVFVVPYAPKGMIAQVQAKTTGVVNATGLAPLYALNATTKLHEVTVTSTDLSAGSIVNLIMW